MLVASGFQIPPSELHSGHFGDATEQAIKSLQQRARLPITGVLDAATAKLIGATVTPPAATPTGAGDKVVLSGIVSRPDGAPMAGTAVRVVRKSLRRETTLADVTTGSDGKFSVAVAAPGSDPLVVRALGSHQELLAESALLRGLDAATWVRLSVGGDYRGPSTFDALNLAIAPHLDGAALHTLAANGDPADLRFLRQATAIPARQLSRVVLASKLGDRSGVDPAAFFALFSQGIPASLAAGATDDPDAPPIDDAQAAHLFDTIALLRADTLRSALAAARQSNVVANLDVDATMKKLDALRIQRIASLPYRVGKTPFGTILDTVTADATTKQQILSTYAAQGDGPAFYGALATTAGIEPQTIKDLRFTLGTSLLLRNHLPLLRYVQQQRRDGKLRSARELAALDAAGWRDLVRASDPTGAELTFIANLRYDSVNERIDHFAQMLANRFDRRYPTAAFAGRMAKDQQLPLVHKADVARFLDANSGFSLRRSHLDRFLKDRPQALNGLEKPKEAVAELKRVQRVYKLVRRYDAAKLLLAGGHHGAQTIYAMGRARFVAAATRSKVLKPSEARAIYARAAQAHATTLALLGNFNTALTRVRPQAVAPPVRPEGAALATASTSPTPPASADAPSPPATPADAPTVLLADFPDLESLFGSVDFCSCEHCRSVYGPAAYLVDILQFLRHRAADAATPTPDDSTFPTVSAKDVLFKRRPDLGAIELNCDNTNIVMPYVDLVCEVLEDAVVPPAPGTARQRQTQGTAEELRANPRFVNEAAYDLLGKAVFPFAMPFDLWTAEVRAFLGQLGVPWDRLLATLQTQSGGGADPADADIAAAALGLDAGALAVLVDQSPAQAWLYWGLADTGNQLPDPKKPDDPGAVITGTWLQVLAYVPILLARANLIQRELVQLFATRYLNTGTPPHLSIVDAGDGGAATCDTGKQSVSGFVADDLTRLQRLVRLWRQLDCPIWDLDKLLADHHFGSGEIDAAFLVQLRRLRELARRTKLPWDELLGLWSDIEYATYTNVLDEAEPTIPSVYERRFRNATVIQASPVFVADPNALAGDLGAPEVIAGVAAALSVSADDIARIRAATGLLDDPTGSPPVKVPLTLPNLSIMFRHAVLAQAVGLPVRDLLTAIAVTGINPFVGAADTLAFLDALDRIKASGFTLLEVDYLVRHGSIAESGIGLTDSVIATSLDDLRRGLARLADGDRPAFVRRHLSDLLGLDLSVVDWVIGNATAPGTTTPLATLFADPRLTARAPDGTFVTPSDRTSFDAIFATFIVLHKLRTFVGRVRLASKDSQWLLLHAHAAGWMGPLDFPAAPGAAVALATFLALRDGVRLQQTLAAAADLRLFDVITNAATATRDEVAGQLASLRSVPKSDIVTFADRFGWTDAAALVATDHLLLLADCLTVAGKLGADAAGVIAFAKTKLAADDARHARQIAKAKYSLAQWLPIAGTIQDTLREQKRAALLAWLLAHPDAARGQKWQSSEELYGFFLIDPEMSPCAETTRIKQAAASVQLFVQRCLLHREPEVVVDKAADDRWAQWDWMKRYRLWEANRKVFLYPENWIDPSLRRDKSPFFVDLENQVLQSEVTNDAAEQALLDYCAKLTDVARLEIAGLFQQTMTTGQNELHVVGRTKKSPHDYYYRKRGTTGVWSPWERIKADIDSEHVLPVIWNRRLHVFWPIFAEKSQPTSSTDRTVPSGGGGVSAEASRYWEIQLAWTEKRNARWLPKRIVHHKQLADRVEKRQLTFKAIPNGRTLNADFYVAYDPDAVNHYGRFALMSGADDASLFSTGPTDFAFADEARSIGKLTTAQPSLIVPTSLTYQFQTLAVPWPGAFFPLTLREGNPIDELSPLGKITQPWVTVAHQDLQFTSQTPFFVADPQRTFFVEPFFVSTVPNSKWPPSGGATFTTAYAFSIFYHPFVDTLIQELNFGGVPGLYNRDLQLHPGNYRQGGALLDFKNDYAVNETIVRKDPDPSHAPYPIEDIDFTHGGAYAAYNWELFFHAPLLIAQRLGQNQKFEDALNWFHYIFNPTLTTGGTVPQRYWITRPFYEMTSDDYANQQIQKLLQLVNGGDLTASQQVADWRRDPFDPHLIASSRPVAYQKAVVMMYISNLIAWGDQLFRGDTIETINEATQLYLLASQLLGPRPENLRAQRPKAAQSFDELAPSLDAFSNALVDVENVIAAPPLIGANTGGVEPPLPALHTFYFCIPPNENLLSYWDLVADRLFKIRHCLNIEGVARPLAIYEPALNPALLVRAAALGVDLNSALSDITAEVPLYRFPVMLQHALDMANELRVLGSAILGALQQKDGEALSQLRANQELALLQAVRIVKQRQIDEAQATVDGLNRSREALVLRRDYYASRPFMNDSETAWSSQADDAKNLEIAATVSDAVAAIAHAIPDFGFGVSGFGGSPHAAAHYGGAFVGRAASAAAAVLRGSASAVEKGAQKSNTTGSFKRRSDDWDLQARTADKELEQMDQQIAAATVRLAVAQADLDNHDLQIENSRGVADFLQSKFTSQELYDWMLSQLSTSYFQAYQLAYDLAKRASKAFAYELGTDDPTFIQFGAYWDSLRSGLAAGDKLLLDLRRMQAEFVQRNQREYEITKHVSLDLLDPMALVKLRQTGECYINLPEALFDLDFPGHYFRRLRNVSVTLACVTGPYTGINATLTLVSHAVRRSSSAAGDYKPATDGDGIPLDDPRFWKGTGAVQAIAVSHGQQDSGLFELSFRDERLLPFEGLGAISHWHLELPRDTNAIDFATLSDVVLHLRYSAREGGNDLRNAARSAVVAALPRSGARVLSAVADFPDAWQAFIHPAGDGQRLDLMLLAQHFPLLPTTQQIRITGVSALLVFKRDQTYADYNALGPSGALKVHLGATASDGTIPGDSAGLVPAQALGLMPQAALAQSGALGAWTVAFAESDLAQVPLLDDNSDAAHHRLSGALVEDVLVAFTYDIEAAS